MAGLGVSTNTGKTAAAFGKPRGVNQVVASSAGVCQIPHLLLHIKFKKHVLIEISHVTEGLCFEVKTIFKPLHETFFLFL